MSNDVFAGTKQINYKCCDVIVFFQGHTCGTPVACIVWVLSPAHV